MGRKTPKPKPLHAIEKHCDGTAGAGRGIALPVMEGGKQPIRRSKNGPRRAAVLIGVYVLMIAHILHWWWAGETLSPVEPSEAMYLFDKGHLTAGFIFFLLALIATGIFGRYFCGWGCHIVALQDACGWMMKKVGIKPRAVRVRLLMWAPLLLALYMFVWPSAYRLVMGIPQPEVTNHLMKAEYWETFPGPVMAIITFVVCGFVAVYFLGAKGYCTYGCPYGGFFAPLDKIAPGRIVVNDSCEHCGHCTAVCTSNVLVHEEVAKYGMVVDPGCMKCMDCVSVCPNDALSFGFKRPSLGAKPSAPRKPARWDFTWGEELVLGAIVLGSFLAYRGLYDQIPLLLALGLAVLTGYLVLKAAHTLWQGNVRLQNLQLKRGGRVTATGIGVLALAGVLLVWTAHSGYVQFHRKAGEMGFSATGVTDNVWSAGRDWWGSADQENRDRLARSIEHMESARAWGMLEMPPMENMLLTAYVAAGRIDKAMALVREKMELYPEAGMPHRSMALLWAKKKDLNKAEEGLRAALALDPALDLARGELGTLLLQTGRPDEALAVFADGIEKSATPNQWRMRRIEVFYQTGRMGELQAALRDIAAQDPESPEDHYYMGMAHLNLGDAAKGIEQFKAAIELRPDFVDAHYQLALALYEQRKFSESEQHLRSVLKVRPHDPRLHNFLAALLDARGDGEGAEEARAKAQELMSGAVSP